MNKNVKRIFFVLTLIMLLATIGAVCAADDANSTSTTDSSVSDATTVSDTASDTVAAEPVTTTSNDNKVDTKTIEKEEKNLKTSTKTVEVNNIDELINSLNEATNDTENDEYIINLKEGNYTSQGPIYINGNSSNTITINGNNQTISIIRSWFSISFTNGCDFIFNDLNITNNLYVKGNIIVNNSNTNEINPQTNDLKYVIINSNTGRFRGQEYSNINYTLINSTFSADISSTSTLNATNSYINYIVNFGACTLNNSTIQYGSNQGSGTIIMNEGCINGTFDNYGNFTIGNDVTFTDNCVLAGNKEYAIDDPNKIITYLQTYNENYIIENVTLSGFRTNNANLIIKNCIVNFQMNNNGNITFDDNVIFGEDCIFKGNGSYIINDTNKITPFITIYNGNYTINNINITSSKTNNGNLTLNNTQINNQFTNNGEMIINLSTINNIFTNNGTLTINNSQINTTSFNNDGNLTIINSNINKKIDNKYDKTITIKNSTINTTINNNGNLIIDDNCIIGKNTLITGNGKISINDTSKIAPYLTTYDGNYTIENRTITSSITNRGNLTINNISFDNYCSLDNYGNISINDSTLENMDYIGNTGQIIINNSKINCYIQNDGTLIIDQTSTIGDEFSIDGSGPIITNNTAVIELLKQQNIYIGENTIENKTINSKIRNYGILHLKNTIINRKINNYGTLYLENTTINQRINNKGQLEIDDESSFGNNCRLSGSGTININNFTKIIPYVDVINGTFTIENMQFNKTYTFDGNITLINSTISQPNYWNYGVLTLKNTIINMPNQNTNWLINYGILVVDDTVEVLNGSINNQGDIIYGELPEILNPKTFEGNNTLENMTLILKSTNRGNLVLINCNIKAEIHNYANLTLINCSFSNNYITNNVRGANINLIENLGNMTIIGLIMENNTFNSTEINSIPTPIPNGIYNKGIMTIINSSFHNNTKGYYYYSNDTRGYSNQGNGGCIINNATLTIDNCNFTNNYAGMYGGAIFGPCNVSNSYFQSNIAGWIGGALNSGDNINNCTFDNNGVEVLGVNSGIGSMIFGSGAVALSNYGNISNSRFVNNYAIDSEGQSLVGVSLTGGALSLSNNNTITNCSFINNTCDHGSAIDNGIFSFSYSNYNNNTITGCLFENNTGNTDEVKSSIINVGGSSSLHLINNTFKNNNNASYLIYNEVGNNITNFYGNDFITTHIYNETIDNNKFIDNNIKIGTLFSLEPDRIVKTDNIYTNTTINDTLTLDIPNRIYTGEPITITGTYTINNPQDYDEFILEQNKFNIYINGELNQTVETLEFTVTPTAGTMMVTVQPTISQTRKTEAIRATTLTNIVITPENYNEYIYEGVLVGVGKDSKVSFNGQFTDKDEIVLETSDIIVDGTNATFTNTVFVLDAQNIILQNMNIENTNKNHPIDNRADNNIITNNTIKLTNNDKTAAINNQASNTLIANNTITVEAPAGDIDFSSGQGVASTQAILLLGGDNNIVQNNTINIKATSTSTYGTLEAITNSNEATNTLITQNTINISGANFNYAIDSLNDVENIIITENTITVTGERYCDGIQVGNNARNILVDNNNITCICINTTELTSEGAITYGVIGTSMGGDATTNMTITNNNIKLTGTANYGIELYNVNTTEIHNNTITVNGPFSMGIGYAYSPNGNATGNNITITGDSTTPINQITEEFKPENVGIRIQNGTTNVSITDNTITTSDVGGQDTTIHTDPDNVTIANNKLTSSNGYGDDTIKAPRNTTVENNTIETNVTNIEYPDYVLTNTPITLTATVSDEFNNPLNSGSVIFSWDETMETAQVTNGTATITTIFTSEGDVTVHARYIPTTTGLTESVMGVSFKIEEPTTKVDIDNVTLTAGETVTLTAKVTDQAGNNITSGKVTFKVNGKTVKDANGKVIYAKVIDGAATVDYTVPEDLAGKDVNITASYSGSSKYNKESTTITKTVAAQEPTLTITPITDDVQTGSTITLKAKIAAGDKAITTGKIVFKINGKTVKDANGKVIYAKVDANGEVSVDYNIGNLKAGNYTIEATFIAPGYDKITSNITMNVVKA